MRRCCQWCMLELRGAGAKRYSCRPCCKGRDPKLQFPIAGATNAAALAAIPCFPSCSPLKLQRMRARASIPYRRCCKCLTVELQALSPELQCTTTAAAMGEPTPSVLQLPSFHWSFHRQVSKLQSTTTGAANAFRGSFYRQAPELQATNNRVVGAIARCRRRPLAPTTVTADATGATVVDGVASQRPRCSKRIQRHGLLRRPVLPTTGFSGDVHGGLNGVGHASLKERDTGTGWGSSGCAEHHVRENGGAGRFPVAFSGFYFGE
jgi:hypothetical protein